ncbi:MAG: hypothetical protein NTZ05_06600 [Chloroflexi bacterium]|nr:hypothetical protein [Chloroflexota bacterium]
MGLPLALLFGGALSLVIVSGGTAWQPWLSMAMPACLGAAVVGLAVARLANSPHSLRVAGVSLAVGVAGLVMAPAAWASAPLQSPVNAELLTYLQANRGDAKYLVATTDSTSAAPLILATGDAVIDMGGFNSTDPAPTAPQLAAMVRAGELRFVLLGGTGGFGLNGAGERTDWVRATCGAVAPAAYGGAASGFGGPGRGQGGGQQLYDCQMARSAPRR